MAIDYFHHSAFCCKWRYQQLRRLALVLTMASYRKGDVIYAQNSACQAVYFVLEGELEVQRQVEVVQVHRAAAQPRRRSPERAQLT